MTNHLRTLSHLGGVGAALLSVVAACSAGSPAATKSQASRRDSGLLPATTPVRDVIYASTPEPSASEEHGPICNHRLVTNDIPLVTSVFPISDACPSQRHQLTPAPSSTVTDLRRGGIPGQYCLTGVVTTGYAFLVVSFDHINDQEPPVAHVPLDVQALDIQQIHFALDAPPPNGLSVSIAQIVEDNCSAARTDCIFVPGFFILGEQGQPRLFNESGAFTFDLAEFQPGPGSASGATLDPTRLGGLQFNLVPDRFDFCIHDFEFRDGEGRPVVNAGG